MKQEAVGVVRQHRAKYLKEFKTVSLWRTSFKKRKRGLSALLIPFEAGQKVRIIVEAISGGLFEEAIR